MAAAAAAAAAMHGGDLITEPAKLPSCLAEREETEVELWTMPRGPFLIQIDSEGTFDRRGNECRPK